MPAPGCPLSEKNAYGVYPVTVKFLLLQNISSLPSPSHSNQWNKVLDAVSRFSCEPFASWRSSCKFILQLDKNNPSHLTFFIYAACFRQEHMPTAPPINIIRGGHSSNGWAPLFGGGSDGGGCSMTRPWHALPSWSHSQSIRLPSDVHLGLCVFVAYFLYNPEGVFGVYFVSVRCLSKLFLVNPLFFKVVYLNLLHC